MKREIRTHLPHQQSIQLHLMDDKTQQLFCRIYCLLRKIVFGVNSFDRLKRYLLDLNIKQNILLVTGRGAMKQHGYVDRLERIAYDKTVYHFDQVSPNPTLEDIEQGIRFVNNTNIELVIALGGGSAMDVGKILAILFYIDSTTFYILPASV